MRHQAGFLVSILFLTAACAGGDAAGEGPEVVRRDSAGVAVVESRGGDRPLDWSFQEVLRLGGADDGPEAFYQPTVATDARGRIYVLDRGEHRVSVFDTAGRHLRTFGREGGGPGELQMPGQLAVTADGVVAVQDWGKHALVRWDSAGQPIEQFRLRSPMLYDLRSVGARLAGEYVTMAGFGETADSTRHTLTFLSADENDSTAVARAAVAPGREIDLGCVRIGSMAPLFQPDLAWGVAGDRFVIADGAAYELELRDGRGELQGLVRRDVAPTASTLELATREVGDSMRVTFGGGRGCAAAPDKVVEQRGYAETVPAVRSVVGAPGGGWWVFRGVGERDAQTMDVFAADGAYVGTLPADAPHPQTFLSDDLLVTIERDEFDLPYVVVYRIVREPAED